MGFLDGIATLLRPKVKHPDAQVRSQAVAQCKDQSLLAEVALADPVKSIRLAAVERIERADLLVKIAASGKHTDVSLAALARISDEPALAEVARSGGFGDVRLAALGRIGDLSLLAAVAEKLSETNLFLKAQSMMSKTAYVPGDHPDGILHETAQALVAIAGDAPSFETRRAQLIAQQTARMAELLKRTRAAEADRRDKHAAIADIQSIEDLAELFEIAHDDDDPRRRIAALSRIQGILFHSRLSADEERSRWEQWRAATSRLLADTEDVERRREIVSEIPAREKELLSEIAVFDGMASIRAAARAKLEKLRVFHPETVIPPEVDHARPFQDGLARFTVTTTVNNQRVLRHGFLDRRWKVALEPIYYDATDFHEGVCGVDLGATWGYIDRSGGFVIGPHPKEPGSFSLGPFADGEATVEVAGTPARFAREK